MLTTRNRRAAAPAPTKAAAKPAGRLAPAKTAAAGKKPTKSAANDLQDKRAAALAKARAARAAGAKPAAKKAAAKKPAKAGNYAPLPEIDTKVKPTWQAPEDFHPALFEVQFMTDIDGLISNRIAATRIQGTYDKAPERARRKLASYDQSTLLAIAARINAAIFVTNKLNRLPPKTQFKVLYRVGVKKETGELAVGCRQAWIARRRSSGVIEPVLLERSDPMFRRIRRSTQFLGGAFANAIMPPKLGRGQSDE